MTREKKCRFEKIPQRAEKRILAKCEAIVFISEVGFERCLVLQQFIEWPLRLPRQVQQAMMHGRGHIGQLAFFHDCLIPRLQDMGALCAQHGRCGRNGAVF